jgi:hypothetical protein
MKITINSKSSGDDLHLTGADLFKILDGKHTPPNKGKKLEDMYDPEKVKKIRRRIHRSQKRRWARLKLNNYLTIYR